MKKANVMVVDDDSRIRELLRLLNEEAERLSRTRAFLEDVKPIVPRLAVDLEALIREGREGRPL